MKDLKFCLLVPDKIFYFRIGYYWTNMMGRENIFMFKEIFGSIGIVRKALIFE